jgi:RNA polymerase sigma-70 factor (ECF subfamily)
VTAVLAPARSPWDLVAAAQRGDARAFGRLYEHYRSTVRHFVRSRLMDAMMVDDFVQETFLRALANLDRLHDQGHDPAAWFVAIARNLILDHVKSARYRREVTAEPGEDWQPIMDGPEHQVIQWERAADLWERVRSLTPQQRDCLLYRFGLGLSVEETAQRMGRNAGAVRTLQFRAIRRLAELMGTERPDLPSTAY